MIDIPATDRQMQVFEFIRSYRATRHHPPTYREIGEAMGLKSNNSVWRILETLRRRRLITWLRGKPRTLRTTG